MPDDLPLRLLLAEHLLGQGLRDESVAMCAEALRRAPDDARARELMVQALAPTATPAPGARTQPSSETADAFSETADGAPVRPAGPARAPPPTRSTPPPPPAAARYLRDPRRRVPVVFGLICLVGIL
ncbi:tetratricopeptide repeat protein, partial [Frankia nepalensis]|uniref:tetratricopeptide repeat protein n=1 Tax=Frankia nepalensis TaxID=1836974 RepID=UPI001EE4A5F9